MVADHAEEDPATAVVEHLAEDHTEVVDCAGIAEEVVEDRTAEVADYSFAEHSLDGSSGVPRVEVQGVAGDHVEGH